MFFLFFFSFSSSSSSSSCSSSCFVGQIAEGIAGLFAGRAIATDFNASGTAPPGRVIRCARAFPIASGP